MRDLASKIGPRKRLATTASGSSVSEGKTGIVPIVIAFFFAVVLIACLIAPDEVDGVLGRTASAVAGKSETNQVWRTVVATIGVDDVEDAEASKLSATSAYSDATRLRENDVVTTDSEGRVVLTRRHDILELKPESSISVSERGEEAPVTIIDLIKGSINVKAAKRTDGGTLSVETQYLVATVKGTKFEVTVTEEGAAVTVTEGVVWVARAGTSEGIDVTPGRTAVVSAGLSGLPRLMASPTAGSFAAIHAVASGILSNGNHHHRR